MDGKLKKFKADMMVYCFQGWLTVTVVSRKLEKTEMSQGERAGRLPAAVACGSRQMLIYNIIPFIFFIFLYFVS